MTTTENTITAGNNLTSLRDKQIYDFFDIVKQTNDDLLNQ
jgi:hypothetical protein